LRDAKRILNHSSRNQQLSARSDIGADVRYARGSFSGQRASRCVQRRSLDL